MRKLLPPLIVAALSVWLLTPLCGVVYRCGCRPLGLGGESHCNVVRPAGAHCPWCEHRWLGALAAGLILGGQLVVLRHARRRFGAAASVGVALFSLAPIGVAASALSWLPTDYPHFLVMDARARLGLPKGPIPCVVPRPHPH